MRHLKNQPGCSKLFLSSKTIFRYMQCHQGHNAAVLYDLQMICRLFAPFFLFSSSLTVLHLWLPKTPSSSMPSVSSSCLKSPIAKRANASLNLPLVNLTRLNQPTFSFIFYDLKGWGDIKPPDELKVKAYCKRVQEDERGELRKPKISYKFWEEKKTFFYWRLPSGWWTQGLVAFARKFHHIYQVSADKKFFSSIQMKEMPRYYLLEMQSPLCYLMTKL